MGTWQYPSCYDRAVKFNSGGNAQDAKYIVEGDERPDQVAEIFGSLRTLPIQPEQVGALGDDEDDQFWSYGSPRGDRGDPVESSARGLERVSQGDVCGDDFERQGARCLSDQNWSSRPSSGPHRQGSRTPTTTTTDGSGACD